jgi:hypothetical protein
MTLRDVRISVWPESLAMPVREAHLYAGIHRVRLERFLEVCFIPAFRRTRERPPGVPDPVRTAEDARLATALQSDYSVTPAEAAPAIDSLDIDAGRRVLFLVEPARYATFANELESLSARRTGVHDVWRASEVEQLTVVRYLLDTVVPSGALRPEDRARVFPSHGSHETGHG